MQRLHEADDTDVKPNTVSFNSAITAWANSHDSSAARQAEAILAQMKRLHKAGNTNVKPDMVSFNSVITASIVTAIVGKLTV